MTDSPEVDLDAVAADFTFAPTALIEASNGVWTGWFDVEAADPTALTDARFEVRFADARPTWVTSLLVGTIEGPDGEFLDIREVSPNCPPRYELRADGVFAAGDGTFDETLDLTVSATQAFAVSPHDLIVHGTLGLDEVQGTAVPRWDASAWETTTWDLRASRDEDGSMYGTTSWVSTGPVDSDDVYEARENFGGFSLNRQP